MIACELSGAFFDQAGHQVDRAAFDRLHRRIDRAVRRDEDHGQTGLVAAHPPKDAEPVDGFAYALRNRIDHGVWGGTSERQRRRILKSRRDAAAPIAV